MNEKLIKDAMAKLAMRARQAGDVPKDIVQRAGRRWLDALDRGGVDKAIRATEIRLERMDPSSPKALGVAQYLTAWLKEEASNVTPAQKKKINNLISQAKKRSKSGADQDSLRTVVFASLAKIARTGRGIQAGGESGSLDGAITAFLGRVAVAMGEALWHEYRDSLKGFRSPFNAGYLEMGISSEILNRYDSSRFGELTIYVKYDPKRSSHPTIRIAGFYPRNAPFNRELAFLESMSPKAVVNRLGSVFSDDLATWFGSVRWDKEASLSRQGQDGESLFSQIRPRDTVTIITPRGQKLRGSMKTQPLRLTFNVDYKLLLDELGLDPRTSEGKRKIVDFMLEALARVSDNTIAQAFLRGPYGWVLNTGGRHGTPAIASEDNVVAVSGRSGRQAAGPAPAVWVPAEARDQKPLEPDKTDLRIWTYEDKAGRPYAITYAGKSQKPLWHNRFRSTIHRQETIEHTIKDRQVILSLKQQRRDERKQYQHDFQVGDILYSSWGYDQTNIDWYKVTKVIGKQIEIREVAGEVARSERGADYVVPDPHRVIGAPLRKTPTQGGYVRITSYASASKWDGKPKYQTAAGYGH